MKRSFLQVLVLSLVLLLPVVAGPAAANSLPVDFALGIEATNSETGMGMGSMSLAMLDSQGKISVSTDPEAGTTTVMLTEAATMGDWMLNSWQSMFKEDPFITNNFTVTNNTAVTATFVTTVSSPVSPTLNADQIIQSTVQVSVLDNDNLNGATLTSASPTAIYQGQVNGTTQLNLLLHPQTISCTDPVDCLLNGSAADGVASQAFGPVAATNMGIVITFTLSPGDSAGILSRFEIIPEPGTIALLATGLGGLAFLGRRRQ